MAPSRKLRQGTCVDPRRCRSTAGSDVRRDTGGPVGPQLPGPCDRSRCRPPPLKMGRGRRYRSSRSGTRDSTRPHEREPERAEDGEHPGQHPDRAEPRDALSAGLHSAGWKRLRPEVGGSGPGVGQEWSRGCRGRPSPPRRRITSEQDRDRRADPGELPGAQRLQRAAAPVPGQDHHRRRGRGMGGVHHPVPGGELRDQGHHRGHGRAGGGQGPAGQHRRSGTQLRDQKWWYGYSGGIGSYAVAAIDMALWDIKGKLLGASVLDLLGGAVHEQAAGGRVLPRALRGHRQDGGGGPGVGRARPPRRQGGLRQARQRAPGLSSTIGTSSTCAGCARAWGPTS